MTIRKNIVSLRLAACAAVIGLAFSSCATPEAAQPVASQGAPLFEGFCDSAPDLCPNSLRVESFWREFCTANPSFCESAKPESAPLSAHETIFDINRRVNDSVAQAERLPLRLTMPGGAGDCKAYAMTKYFLLAWSGIPAGAMRFAAVHTPGCDRNHFVLLVRIGGELFLLDNLTDVVWRAAEARYEWLAVQREDDRASWQDVLAPPL